MNQGLDPASVLLGLCSGLLGGLAVAAIEWLRTRRHDRALDRAAARATYFEMVHNLEMLREVVRRQMQAPVTTSTWSETRNRLAARLSVEGFTRVALAYQEMEDCSAAMATTGGLGAPLTARRVELVQRVIRYLELAIGVLSEEGWPRLNDRTRLAAEIDAVVALAVSDPTEDEEPDKPQLSGPA